MDNSEEEGLLKCPFCGNELKKKAKRCESCGSFIEWINDKPIAINIENLYKELYDYLLVRVLKEKLKEIGKVATKLEIKWRGGFISTKKVREQLLSLNTDYEEIKSKLENINEEYKKPFFAEDLEKYKQNLDKLEKIESLKDRLKLSKSTNKHLKKELRSEQKTYEKRLIAFMKHYKHLVNTIKSKLKNAIKRKELLQVKKALNEVDIAKYDEKVKMLDEEIEVYKEMLNYLKDFKKELQLLRIYY